MAHQCVIFDIDGTLADNSHRVHHLLQGQEYHLNGPERWQAFFDGIPHDTPIKPVVTLAQVMWETGFRIVLCTGRSTTNEAVTRDWLSRHGIKYDAIYFRESDCFRPDAIVKSELLDRIIADGFEPLFVVDDRESVVAMWRERGLVCLQCAPGKF